MLHTTKYRQNVIRYIGILNLQNRDKLKLPHPHERAMGAFC